MKRIQHKKTGFQHSRFLGFAMLEFFVLHSHTVGERVLRPLFRACDNNELFKGLRPPAADPQQNEGMMLRGYENHEAIALVTCAS